MGVAPLRRQWEHQGTGPQSAVNHKPETLNHKPRLRRMVRQTGMAGMESWRAAAKLAALGSLALVLALAPLRTASAQPYNGIGLAAGYAYHHDGPDLGSSGLSIAGDEQYLIGHQVSVNPQILLSEETAFGHTSPTLEPDGSLQRLPIHGTARHVAIALQIRRYFGLAYVGAQVGLYYRYYENLFAPASTATQGGGLAAGWESPGGWTFGGQIDSFSPLSSDPPYGIRLHIGYRWH